MPPGMNTAMNAWLRDHPWQADGLLAAALLVVSAPQVAAGQTGAAGRVALTAVTVLLAASVVPRRRYPGAAFSAAAVIGATQIAFGVQNGGPGPVFALQPTNADLAILVLLYTLAAYRSRPVSITGLAVCLVGSAVAIARWSPANGPHPAGALFAAAAGLGGLTLTAWVLGDSVAYRYRRAYYASLEERAARLEAERDAQARIAAAAERARELQERRARAVDDSAARLRGIERDLHDGAQVRLAALAMTLGEIKENLEQSSGDDHTLALAGAAHQNAKDTLAELRDLARGIHPPVLDRGLGPALGILAGTSAIPVGLTVALAERPSPAIEAMAYFCTAELLANAAKHSGASRVTVSVREQDSGLAVSVADDGDGGARLVPGGGLAGLRERVQTVDGRLEVGSPPGGPTIVTIELPRHA
ncbi:MAG TPA: ATP-binding protein [Streptosporangiaceae bacterium]|nr:ATP-binding protein [Streptosporangiaceae bacterium]